MASQIASPVALALPTPFDVGFNHNVTNECQAFMNSMTKSAIFKQCLPLSMIMQTAKHYLSLTALLDYSCSAPVGSCTKALNSYAQNITKTEACAEDLTRLNPKIKYAMLGLKSYQTVYNASCIKSSTSSPINQNPSITKTSNPAPRPSGSSYCFANAMTNISNPTDSYIYFLPLNVSLVGSAVPTCNSCLQSTMSTFRQATSNRSNALSTNYVLAANQVNVVCGPEFVNATLAAVVSSANLVTSRNRMLLVLFSAWLFIFAGLNL